MRRLSITIFMIMMATLSSLHAQDITIVDQPTDVIACKGTTNHMLTVIANATNNANMAYQWYRDGVMLQEGVDFMGSTTSPGLFLDTLDYHMNGLYTCTIMTNGDMETTEGVIVHVEQTPAITRQPMGTTTDLGQIAMLDVEGNFRGELQDYSVEIQWYRNDQAILDNEKYSGANSSVLLINNIEEADYADEFHVVVNALCGQITSQKTSVLPMPGVEITSQPMTNIEADCEGNSVTVMIEAEATNGGDQGLVGYQWYQNGTLLNDNQNINGSESATLTAALLEGMNTFHCEIRYDRQNTMSSESATATGYKSAEFSEDLENVEVTEEEMLTVEAPMAEGYGSMTYTWYMQGSTDAVANGATFTIESATFSDAGTYYCEVENECGSDMSNTFTVTVNPKQETTGIVETAKYSLTNTPNPFTDYTTISFEINDPAASSLMITDMMGNKVVEFANLRKGLNSFRFSPATYGLTSGVYYFTLSTDGDIATGKMIFNK